MFKVQLQLNMQKNFQEVFKVQFKSTGFEKKIQKEFKVPTQVRPEWKKNQSFKVQMPGCEMSEKF